MIPLDFQIETVREGIAVRGGLNDTVIGIPTLQENRFAAVAYDPAAGTCLRYTGLAMGLEVQTQMPPDRSVMEQACRDLATALGWTITEDTAA